MDITTHNRAQYLAWLRAHAPQLYNQAMPVPNGVAGFWDSVGSTFNSVISNVTNALPNLANTYSQYQQSRNLIELNTQRAREGLSPLILQNGQLVTMDGQPYTEREWSIARTGVSPMTIGIGIAALLGFIWIIKH